MRVGERILLVAGMSLFAILLFSASPPGLVFGDGAELTYGILTGGVVHPPGYPLYITIGQLFLGYSSLSVPVVASFVSVLFGTLTLAGLYLVLRRRQLPPGTAFVTLVVLAIAYPFWDVSVKPEVYTLAAFLLVSTVFFWDFVRSRGEGRLVLWLLAGVSLAHHPLGLLNFLLAVHATWRTLPGFSVAEAIVFVLPLGLYATLLVPGTGEPFNWPMIGSADALYSHLLGGTFTRFFLLDGLLTPLVQFGRVSVAHLLAFPLFLLVFVIGGYWWHFSDLGFLLALQALLVAVLLFYGVPDVRDFLFPSYIIAALAFAYGVEAYRPRSFAGFLDVVLLVVLSWGLMAWVLGDSLRYNWRDYTLPRDYAVSVQEINPTGTVLSDWSHYSVLRYYQLTHGFYPKAHLLTPMHRYGTWSEVTRFHASYGEVFTTVNGWELPENYHLVQHGPIYRVRSESDE